MTLEDFFTLTELKDGLTAPARVNELITVMQNEKDCIVKNLGKATRQWSAVGSTIAATENKDCLDLFIQLDGLWFIDTWLKDVQKLGNESGNGFVEESVIALLRALERLQIDNHRSVSAGIGRTVQSLVGHSSSAVHDKARALCGRWMLIPDNDAAPEDVKKLEALDTGTPSVAISPSCRNDNEEKNAEQSRYQSQTMPLTSSDSVQQVNDEETITLVNLVNQEPMDPVDSSSKSKHVGGDLSVEVETPKSKSEGTPITGTDGSMPTVQGSTYEVQSDVYQLDKYIEDAKEKQEINSPHKAGVVEMSTLSSPLEQIASCVDVSNGLESAIKTDLREDTSDKDEDMADDGASLDHCRSITACRTRNQVGDSGADALQDSPGDECKWGEAENPKSLSNSESAEESDNAKEHGGVQSDDNSGNGSCFFKLSVNDRSGGLKNKTSDMELDYGMIDPLEVARQVALEVEREVDSRERSCSTSEKISGGGAERPNSQDSTNGKENQPIGGSGQEVSSAPESSPKASSTAAEPVNDAETLVSERASCKPDITASQISEVAQESEANTERGFSGFDLNQEVCSEEIDHSINPTSSVISVVSASRAAAATGLPDAPLQFEGTLGWKGSAATSAFRRIPEGEKAFSSSSNHSNSKQRLDSLDIDLNVAECREDKIEDFLFQNKKPISSSLHSGEGSSAEASPRRSERLLLDLNSLGDGSADAVVLDRRQDGRVASLSQNGLPSPSRSSSSSSMQPSLRNIDLNLNDQPVFANDASLDHPYLGKYFINSTSTGGAFKREESIISIFGAKVEVKHKDSVPHPTGRILGPVRDFNLGRTEAGLGLGSSMHYGNPPLYGHNGFVPGAAMFFSPAMYGSPSGPIPYMGSSSAHPFVFSQPPPPPFIMNMSAAGTSSVSDGSGPSQHNFDLNSGLMIEGGNRDTSGGLRQLFGHSQGRSLDEQYLRANNSRQASSSYVAGRKRQEPDSGLELFPTNKYQPPPWK